MSRLPDPSASRAVLIGASKFPRHSGLPPLSAAANNVADFASALTDSSICGLRPDRVEMIIDSDDHGLIGDALGRAISHATDCLLFYYVGHGLRDVRNGELYLTSPLTTATSPYFTSLRYELVRAALVDSHATHKVVILDCCYSGGAIPQMGGLDEVSLDIAGTFVMASSARNQISTAPSGQRNSAFTGQLLAVLREGDAHGSTLLSLDEIFNAVDRRLRARALPHPQRLAGNKTGQLAFAHNKSPTQRKRIRQVLPIYLACNESASMAGAPIAAVNDLLPDLHYQMSSNQFLSGKARLCLIGFSDTAEVLLPLSDMSTVESVQLFVAQGSGRAFGNLFNKLHTVITEDIAALEDDGFFVLRPLVLLLVDGPASDDGWPRTYTHLFSTSWRASPTLYTFPLGNADLAEIDLLDSTRVETNGGLANLLPVVAAEIGRVVMS